MRDLDIMVVLAALCDRDLRAWWRAIVAEESVRSDSGRGIIRSNSRTSLTNGCIAQVVLCCSPVDGRRARETKRCLVVNVDALWHVRKRNDVHVVTGL